MSDLEVPAAPFSLDHSEVCGSPRCGKSYLLLYRLVKNSIHVVTVGKSNRVLLCLTVSQPAYSRIDSKLSLEIELAKTCIVACKESCTKRCQCLLQVYNHSSFGISYIDICM